MIDGWQVNRHHQNLVTIALTVGRFDAVQLAHRLVIELYAFGRQVLPQVSD